MDEQAEVEQEPTTAGATESRRHVILARLRSVVVAIQGGDDEVVTKAITDLSQTRRYLAPLGLLIGAFVMLFEGVRLLFTNWRLSLIQALPAMWIWAAMMDLKVHMFRGKSFDVVYGKTEALLFAGVVLVTVAAYFLNSVFAFAIARPGDPAIKPGFREALDHKLIIATCGVIVGIALGIATVVMPRHGKHWFFLVLAIVVGLMMYSYVALPSRLLGVTRTASRRDQLSATVIGGVVGAIVCAPAYLVGRLGVSLLNSHKLLIIGIVILSVGLALQAGSVGAVKAIKMSSKLVAGTVAPGKREPATTSGDAGTTTSESG